MNIGTRVRATDTTIGANTGDAGTITSRDTGSVSTVWVHWDKDGAERNRLAWEESLEVIHDQSKA